MNLQNVLSVYAKMRQFTDDESALLKTLQGLNDNERELLVESLSPSPKKSSKKSVGKGGGKSRIPLCAACGYSESSICHSATVATDDYHPFQPPTGKSKHASSLAEKVGGTLASIAKTVGGNDEGAQKILNAIEGNSTNERCQFTRSDGKLCRLLPDHNIHHLTTAMDYHEFVTGKSDAQSAAGGL